MAHPFMTMFLVFWAITCVYEIVYAIAKTVRIAVACKYKLPIEQSEQKEEDDPYKDAI